MALLENLEIKLRALEPEDLDILYRWENDTKLWRYGSALSPYSKLALRQYITDSLEMDVFQSKQLRLMVDLISTSTPIGTVDLYNIDVRNGHAGVGILIDESFRGNNYAYSSLMLLSDYAFHHLSLHHLYAYVADDNKTSLRLFEKAGFAKSGVLKDWVLSDNMSYEDVHILQLINTTIDD